MIPFRRAARCGLALLACIAVLALAGCSTLPGASRAGSTEPGHVTIGLGEEPRTLASWNAYGSNGHTVLRNIQEALLNRDPKTNELVPELATSYRQVDARTWRFELRRGVRFHDGTPFDARNAADGINYVLSPQNAFAMRTFLGPDVTATPAGEYTLDLRTTAPDPILPSRMYFVTIPSYPAIQAHPESYDTDPIGTGPYRFVTWQRGVAIEVEANPDWWGRRDTAQAHGTNTSVTSATYVFRPESEVRAGLVRTTEADLARWITKEQCEDSPKCVYGTGIETIHLRLDTPNPLLADPRIRQAISLSFSRSQLLDDILGGGEPASSLVGPSATGFDPALTVPQPDLARARQLVAQAKASGVDTSIPLRVVSRDGYILRASEAVQLIAQSMRSIGLTNVTSGLQESAGFEEQWAGGYRSIPKDRGWLALGMHGNELLDYSSSFGSFFTCDSSLSAWCDPAFDAAYRAATPSTGDQRRAALARLSDIAYDTHADLPIGQPNFYTGLSDRLTWTPRTDGFLLLKEMTLS